MEVGEGGRHHGSHHASLSALLFAAVPGTEVAVVGQTKDMTLGIRCKTIEREWNIRPTSSCAKMNAELSPSSRFKLQDLSGSQAPETGA